MWLKDTVLELGVAVLIAVWMSSCKSHSDQSAKPNPPATSPAVHEAPPPIAEPPKSDGGSSQTSAAAYVGPPVSVKLLQLQTYPPQSVISIQLTAPTGGWKLWLDRGEVVNNVAKAYFTLERPGKDEMVTQSLVQLNSGYKTTSSFERAEIYINSTQRGIPAATEYRLAATQKVDQSAPPPVGDQQPAPAKPQAAAPAEQYSGPPATVEIVQYKRLPPISEAIVQVAVPTSGWTLTLDRGEVVGDTAKVYFTLEKPAEGEQSAKESETLRQSFKNEKPPFYHAEIYIHEAQRGVQTFATNYRLATQK